MDGEFQTYISQGRRLHPQGFLRQVPRTARTGRAPERRRDLQAAPRRPRSAEGLQRLQARRSSTKGGPTLILAHTVKGYGLGEAGEGRNITHQQKKLNEAGDRALPLALRNSDSRRSRAQRVVLPAAVGQPGDQLPARAPPRSWADTCPAANVPPSDDRGAAAGVLQGIARRLGRPRSLEHHGVRPRADAC